MNGGVNMKKLYVFSSILLLMILLFACGNQNKSEEETTDSSFSDVIEKGNLIVGTTAELPPLEYKDKNGDIVGGDIEIAKEIASRWGIDIEFINLPWEEMLKAAETGTVDFSISSIIITPERQERMLFSIPYVKTGEVIVIHRDNEEKIKGTDDLENFRLGAVKDTVNEKTALEYSDPSNYVAYDNFDTLVADIVDKKIDATIIDYIIGLVWVSENPDLKIVGDPLNEQEYGIATKLGNEALMDEINIALQDMERTGRLQEILDESIQKK
jgi:ABC-type amino acid transport substrate-binding protein